MMVRFHRALVCVIAVLAATLFMVATQQPVHAYVEAPHSLGQVVSLSSNVLVVRVEQVDKQKNTIVYRKVRDLKGTHGTDVIRHSIGQAGFNAREWQYTMAWAEVGKIAVFFHNGGQGETCLGNYWYQVGIGGEWWGMTHGEPFLLRSYCGPVDKLISAVTEIQAGREVIVPCMVDGNKDDLHVRRAKVQRLRASLKLGDYNPKRDFVGWGGEDFRRLAGMPGFTHVSAIARVDADAQSISAADFNGDGKLDLCLAGAGRVALLQNGGESLNEVSLPAAVSGCRAAVWADYNGDGKPDLLIATPSGPKLFTNLGGSFRDDSALLPVEPAYNLTAAAWIDYDGDGKPDLLLGNGFHGLRLYRNRGKADPAPAAPPKPGQPPAPASRWFEDVSDAVGLGAQGIGSGLKGDSLTVCDVDGDGRPDFLYGAGNGLLLRNTAKGFVEMSDSGVRFKPGRVGPVFGDYDGDGHPDLFVPQEGGCKLFRNDGTGHFSDVTERAGLAAFKGHATCAAWGDLDNDGRIDLVVGCLREPNRFFRNKGDGTFEDGTDALGLGQRIFNTQAVCLVDLNNDGAVDVVFNNEGQDSCVLLGNPELAGKQTLLACSVQAKEGVVGSRVVVRDKEGKIKGCNHVSGGEGRGGQAAPVLRFALAPGTYKVEVVFSNGQRRGKEISVAAGAPVRAVLDEAWPQLQ